MQRNGKLHQRPYHLDHAWLAIFNDPAEVVVEGSRRPRIERKLPATTQVLWKGCEAEGPSFPTPRQDISPPYLLSREFRTLVAASSPPSPLPRPTIPISVPNDQEPIYHRPVWNQSLTNTSLPGPLAVCYKATGNLRLSSTSSNHLLQERRHTL
jgi:hypothetical protein